MKPRMVLGLAATAVALATLVLAGRELAHRFSARTSDGAVDMLFPALSVATALITIAIVDWVRNLGVRSGSLRTEEGDEGDDEVADAPRFSAPAEGAGSSLRSAIQSLERLANDELGADKTIEEALRVVASFATASAVTLWMMDEQGQPRLHSRLAEGQVTLGPDPAVEPTDPEALRLAAEHRKVFEAIEGEGASLLVPLASAQGCMGVLKIVASIPGSEEERSRAVQALGQDMAQVARPFAHAVRAPDLYERAVTDPLTGLYTKRHFVNRLTEATGASRRYGEPLSLILLDLDNFGLINSRYGQATGDRLLEALGALARENTREVDGAYRYGSDEVAIILPDTDVDRAVVLAERLRRAVRGCRTVADAEGNVIASVSVGVAEFDEDMRGIGTLIARAEEALHAAKTGGRDRVERWRESAPAAPADESVDSRQ